MRHLLLLYLLLCSVFSFSQTSIVKKLPVPHKAVNDFGRFLTSGESDTLQTELKNYLKRTSNAIVVVTLESLTDPETEKEYAIEEAALLYFNTWGVGDKVKNNGVLLMVSRNPRRVRIQVGTGIETILTNEACQDIVDKKLVPHFKQGLFYPGIKEAVIAIEQLMDNPPAVDKQNATAPYLKPTIVNSESIEDPYKKRSPVIGFLVIGGIVVVCILFFKYGRSPSSGVYASNGYTSRSSHYNSFHNYSSGGSWSSGGSSYSSGGSSYGGGSSSGGGASGSW
jgi:uncharacterized protein